MHWNKVKNKNTRTNAVLLVNFEEIQYNIQHFDLVFFSMTLVSISLIGTIVWYITSQRHDFCRAAKDTMIPQKKRVAFIGIWKVVLTGGITRR